MDDQRERDEEREDDERFLDVWREWRQGRSRDACEAKIAWMLATRSPRCAGVARRDLDREDRGKN
jgi:hypothetical protein